MSDDTPKVTGPRVKLTALQTKGFDAKFQCVALKCLLPNQSEFTIFIPRQITGVIITAILEALSDAPDLSAEENQGLRFSSAQATRSPDGLPTLLIGTQEKVRLPIKMTPENLVALKATVADLERP
jgi:hypothetical protein